MKAEIKMTIEEAQEFFKTDIQDLMNQDDDSLECIEQCHFGDLLIEYVETEGKNPQRLKLWKVIEENGGGILIEYSGKENDWTWQTVYES